MRVRGATDEDEAARKVTLDDYMQLLWQRFGRAGGAVPGVVERPYTQADANAALAELTGDQVFADDFFDRYVDGHDVIDYAPLFERAGLVLRPRAPGQTWLGSPSLSFGRGGGRLTTPVGFGSPLHDAGVERDDVLVSLDGRPLSSERRLEAVSRIPGAVASRSVDKPSRIADPRTAAASSITIEPAAAVFPLPRSQPSAPA